MNYNNQNVLNMSSSSNEQINSQLLKKRIQIENQKTFAIDQKIKEIKKKIQDKRKAIQNKKQKLNQIKENIKKLKQNQNNQSQNQNGQKKVLSVMSILSSSLLSGSSQAQLQIIKHLRQHFKALRHQVQYDDQDQSSQYYDEVDVDNMTYEQLLQLGQKIGKVSKGLDKKNIEALKIQIWGQQNNQQQKTQNVHSQECSICRDQFEKGNQYISLSCSHAFHNDCIKQWLKMQKTCPYCKTQIFTSKEDNPLKPLNNL